MENVKKSPTKAERFQWLTDIGNSYEVDDGDYIKVNAKSFAEAVSVCASVMRPFKSGEGNNGYVQLDIPYMSERREKRQKGILIASVVLQDFAVLFDLEFEFYPTTSDRVWPAGPYFIPVSLAREFKAGLVWNMFIMVLPDRKIRIRYGQRECIVNPPKNAPDERDPRIPANAKTGEFPGSLMADLKAVFPYMSKDDSRRGLRCVQMKSAGMDYVLEATDGKVLCMRSTTEDPVWPLLSYDNSYLIKHTVCTAIGKVFKKASYVSWRTGHVKKLMSAGTEARTHIRADNRSLVFSEEPASFPCTKQIIPDVFKMEFTIPSFTLLWAMSGLMENPSKLHRVQMTVKPDGDLDLVCDDSAGVFTTTTTLHCTATRLPEEITLCFLPEPFMKLCNMEGDITVMVNDPVSPVMFRSRGSMCLIMPMRIGGREPCA